MTSLVLAALLGAAPAAGQHILSVGASFNHVEDTIGVFPDRWSVEAAYAYERGPCQVGGGLRFAFPRGAVALPADIYLRGLIKADIGYWSPAVGPELGFSGEWVDPGPRPSGLPNDVLQNERPRRTPFYVAMHAMPLRFKIGRLVVSALEVQLATTVTPLAGVVRIQVGVLQVGMKL